MPVADQYIPHYTVEDYRRWQGDWELLGGVPVAMSPSPDFVHQKVASRLHYQLMRSVEQCPSCIALYEMDWIVSEDTVLRPDIILVCGEPEGDYITRAPKIVVEVVSRNTAYKDERVKFEIYE